MFILQIAPGIVYVAPDMHRKYPGTFLEGVSMINRRKKRNQKAAFIFQCLGDWEKPTEERLYVSETVQCMGVYYSFLF